MDILITKLAGKKVWRVGGRNREEYLEIGEVGPSMISEAVCLSKYTDTNLVIPVADGDLPTDITITDAKLTVRATPDTLDADAIIDMDISHAETSSGVIAADNSRLTFKLTATLMTDLVIGTNYRWDVKGKLSDSRNLEVSGGVMNVRGGISTAL